MALLGDLDAVRQMIRADPAWDMGSDIDKRLLLIQKAVTAALEEKCGRTWGTPSGDTSYLVWVGAGDTLVLPKPARSITSVQVGGTVTGSMMTGGRTWLPRNVITDDDGLIYAISGGDTGSLWVEWWWGSSYQSAISGLTNRYVYPVLVTGDFADTDDDGTIPDDVSYVATYLIAEQLKKESASPAGFLGPEGVVPIRDAWKDPMVKAVIDRHGIRRKVMAV